MPEVHGEPLVSIRDHGLFGSNFYWHKYANHGLSREDIIGAGVVGDQVYVHPEIIPSLLSVDAELKAKGWRLYIKEGYRSPQVYDIVYKRRVEKYGKEETDRLLNVIDMPHASGKTVDAAIWDTHTDSEVYLRRGEDGANALFINFYKDKSDPDARHLQELQDYLATVMLQNGFRIGVKREYFHFNYDPKSEPNYY